MFCFIFFFRKFLEGEEIRFSIFVGSIIGSLYIYRQFLVIIFSKIQKIKVEVFKLKVQYKFVEEIIEEIKVEDEKLEMEEVLIVIVEEMVVFVKEEKGEEVEEKEEE